MKPELMKKWFGHANADFQKSIVFLRENNDFGGSGPQQNGRNAQKCNMKEWGAKSKRKNMFFVRFWPQDAIPKGSGKRYFLSPKKSTTIVLSSKIIEI